MSSQYRGVLKIAGSQLRGWLIDAARPERRVRFNLIVDGQLRGTYAANRRRRFLIRQSGSGEDTHGFSVPIRKQWISGEIQIVRIEDPADSALNVSLSVRLGPAPNTHFDEQVVSGQISIGGGDRAAPDPRAKTRRGDDDEAEQDVRPKAVNKSLMKQISALSDADLANLLLAIDRDVVVQRLARHERSGDWQSASVYRRSFLGAPAEQRLVALGRSAVKAHNYGLAARVASAAAALHPESLEAHLLAGNTKTLQGEFDEALRHLRIAERLEKNGVRARREIAAILARMLRGDMPAEGREHLRAEYLSILRALSASDDAIIQMKYRMMLAHALFSAGRYDEAIAAADDVLSRAANDTRALMVKARSLVARNRVGEARSVYDRILDIEPGHRGAKTNMRILAALSEDESMHQDDVTAPTFVGSAHAAARRDGVSLVHHLTALPQRWICTTQGHTGEDLSPQLLLALGVNAMHRVGYTELAMAEGRRLEFWRRDALISLAESGLLESLDDAVGLNRWKPFYGARARRENAARANGTQRGIVALISRNGAEMYGGGEHFLDSAADHHARQGFEPVVVGTRADLRGRERMSNGRRCAYVGDSSAELRKFLLENDVSLVHAISGTGFLVAEALGYANIPFLYGVHFWNELLGDTEQTEYFDAASGTGRFRREFQLIVSRATAIYANSQYTQKLVEEGFGLRCPIVYAVPRERDGTALQH